MSNKAKAKNAAPVVELDLDAYVDGGKPEAFTVPGIKGTLYGKQMSIDEAAAVIRTAGDATKNFITELCAVAVVNEDGTPRGNVAWWGSWKSRNSDLLLLIFAECKRINGMVSAQVVGEAGNDSGETTEPA